MARPFQKPRTRQVSQYWCPNCEVWGSRDDFTEGDYYTVDNDGGCIEVDGEYYYDDYTSWSIWTHDDCGEPVASADNSPETRVISSTWVCGECKSEYEDYDEAMTCCQ